MTLAAAFSPSVPAPKPAPRRDLLRRYLVRCLLRERGALGLKILIVRVFPSAFLTGGLHALLILRKRVWGGMVFDEQIFELAAEALNRPFADAHRRRLHGNQVVQAMVGVLAMLAMLAWMVGIVRARESARQMARAWLAGPPIQHVDGWIFISAVSLAYAIIIAVTWRHARHCALAARDLHIDYTPRLGATIPFAASLVLLLIGAWWTIPATIAWGVVWHLVGIDSNRWGLPLGAAVRDTLMKEVENQPAQEARP